MLPFIRFGRPGDLVSGPADGTPPHEIAYHRPRAKGYQVEPRLPRNARMRDEDVDRFSPGRHASVQRRAARPLFVRLSTRASEPPRNVGVADSTISCRKSQRDLANVRSGGRPQSAIKNDW